ncbi:MAG: Ca-activated chloride channel family protein [Flavobacteriales bacterium]|jgi:Ca-activated chloride channel family protein
MRKSTIISLSFLIALNALLSVGYLLVKEAHEYASPHAFWLLFIIPITSFLFHWRRLNLQADVKIPMLVSSWKSPVAQLNRHWIFALRMLAFFFLIIVLARPQSSSSTENLTREGIDIVLAMDLSFSMLSQDFSPNRLESSKETAIQFVDERPDDRIGVVVYEGESFTQVPLTTDHIVVKNGIASLKTGMVEGGTAIGMGLATAVNRLKDSEAKSKIIVLLTDGVNNAGQIQPQDAAQLASLFNIRVYTVGVGTIGKAKTPVTMQNGQYVYDWRDVEIDEDILKLIAEKTGGRYFRATSEEKLGSIYKEIDQLEKTRFNVFQINRKTENFKYYLACAIGFLLLEFIVRHLLIRSIT